MRALYNNLKATDDRRSATRRRSDGGIRIAAIRAELALEIDETVKRVRPDGWRGHQAREKVIKARACCRCWATTRRRSSASS